MGKLGTFEGLDVLNAGLEIRNAAGGLNESMKVDPETWHKDEEITVVMRCKVDKIRFDPVKDLDGWRRVHILSATEAAVIDDSIVAEVIDEQARRIEEAKGIHRLPIAQQEAHERGEHAEALVEGCPACDAEAEAEAAEAGG